PRQKIRGLMEPVGDSRAMTRLYAFDHSEDRSQVTGARAGRDLLDNSFVERQKSDRVVLANSEICQGRCEVLCILELRHLRAAVVHRGARVDQQMDLRVCVSLIFFYVEAIGASQQLPVEMSEIVARHVLPVLGEVGREPEVRRAVKTRDEAFDDRAGN